jgi:hypothetical protein
MNASKATKAARYPLDDGGDARPARDVMVVSVLSKLSLGATWRRTWEA